MKQISIILTVILVFFAEGLSFAQTEKSPSSDTYFINRKFDVKHMGLNESLDQNNIAYFCDDITLENFNFFNGKLGNVVYGKCKNVLIIANVLRMDGNNWVTLESFAGNKFERDGGSFTIICRKLIITEKARLNFSGTTSFPFITTFGAPYALKYEYGYGAGLYIATEKLIIDETKLKKLRDSHISGYNYFLQKIKGNVINDPIWWNNPYSNINNGYSPKEAVNMFEKYKNNISNEDRTKFLKLIVKDNKVDDELIKIINNLYALDYDNMSDSDRLTSLFINQTLSNAISLAPFNNITFLNKPLFLAPKNSQVNFIDYNKDYGIPITSVSSGAFLEKQRSLQGQQIIDVRGSSVIGTLVNENIFSKLSADHRKLFSAWAVERLQYLYNEIEVAKLLSDEKKIYELLGVALEMPRYSLEAPFNNNYYEIYRKILLQLNYAKNIIVKEQILDNSLYKGSTITYLKKGVPGKYYLPPNDLLITGIRSLGGYKYGILELSGGQDKTYRLQINAELKNDPIMFKALEKTLNDQFSKNVEKETIPFIKYNIELIDTGLVDHTEIITNGSQVAINMTIKSDKLAATMFQISTLGLQFKLRWFLEGSPNQSGDLQDVRLKLNKRSNNELLFDNISITNPTNTKITVSYVITNLGRILFLNDIVLDKKEKYQIPSTLLLSNEIISEIPDMSVTFDDGTFEQTINRFLQIEPNMIVERINVKNNIPITVMRPNTELQLQVESVDVKIELLSENETANLLVFHRLLAPYGSFGSESKAETPRISINLNKYRISGKVNFIDGGTALLKSRIFDGSQLDLTVSDIDFN